MLQVELAGVALGVEGLRVAAATAELARAAALFLRVVAPGPLSDRRHPRPTVGYLEVHIMTPVGGLGFSLISCHGHWKVIWLLLLLGAAFGALALFGTGLPAAADAARVGI